MSTATATMVLPAARLPRRGQTQTQTQTQPRLRLTRRGRLVVFVAGLLVAIAVAVACAGVSVATAEKGEPVPTDTILVGTGVTLWDIASARSEGGDVREMVATIQRLNHLEGGMLVAGQQLRVPTGD